VEVHLRLDVLEVAPLLEQLCLLFAASKRLLFKYKKRRLLMS